MTSTIWTQPSGHSLGTINESIPISIQLPVNNLTGVIYTIISGDLPPGLTLIENNIVGTPYIITSDITYIFCIRANYENIISDRTFSITVTGNNPPEFVLNNENLDIGINNQYFVLDGTYIEYQISATELIPELRKNLVFFISNGQLPPGLTLKQNGDIYGTINALSNTSPDNQQTNFTFTISVTDGILTTSKNYSIYVVGPMYLTADNSSMLNANHLFTADITPMHPIQWKTSSNLGTYRSTNYIIIPIETIDNTGITFTIDNEDNLPPGMFFDKTTASIFGTVPSLSVNSILKTFTITATRNNYFSKEFINSQRTFSIEIINDVETELTWNNINGTGSHLIAELGYDNNIGLPNSDELRNIKILSGGSGYTHTPDVVIIPTNGGENASAYATVVNGAIFNVDVIFPGTGYITAPDIKLSQPLGTLKLNDPSTFYISAKSSDTNSVITYNLIYGSLPPGLSLYDNGEIIGKINSTKLTTFGGTTFDLTKTTLDRNFVFTVNAKNQIGSSKQPFSILVDDTLTKQYSNIYVNPLLPKEQRVKWFDFINNTSIFPLEILYRINDNNFGLNKNLSMLIFAGIETAENDVYIKSTLQNLHKKQFIFKDISSSIAIDPVTSEKLYEVVYIKMQDPREYGNKHISKNFEYQEKLYNTNSVTNWQVCLSESVDQNYIKLSTQPSLLPLWMKTMTKTQTPGFILALPICYCKVGAASEIILNINNYISQETSNFKFNHINYTIDRFVIDKPDNNGSTYLIFDNKRTTI